MDAKKYALFVDNMTIKVYRYKVEQVYGTNQDFDRETGKFAPPLLKNIDSVNYNRRLIGLPELNKNQYRDASKQ